MKLELKHLAAYLPYNLRVKHASKLGNIKKESILTISDYPWLFRQAYFKPILRPLPDLTKEIEINGQKFFPINEYFLLFGGGVNAASVINWKNSFVDNILYTPYVSLSYGILEKLFEWHFDVFKLIENGLAIDANKV
jgi:hypothetical protein